MKPLLAELKCTVTMSDSIRQVGDRVYVEASAVLLGPDGEVIRIAQACAREPKERKGMDESQITGATSSYARKYALNGLFLIDDNVDSDYLNKGERFESAVNKSNQRENPYKVEDLPKGKAKSEKQPPAPGTKKGEKVEPRPDLGANPPSGSAPEDVFNTLNESFEDSKPLEVGESERYDTPVTADPLVKEFEDEMNVRMEKAKIPGASAKSLDAFILYLKTKHNIVGNLDDLKVKNVQSGQVGKLWDQFVNYLNK